MGRGEDFSFKYKLEILKELIKYKSINLISSINVFLITEYNVLFEN